jgi:hypothetical protein
VENLTSIAIYKDRVGTPENLTIEIRPSKEDGTISQETLIKTTLPPEKTAIDGGRLDEISIPYTNLVPGETYWIVLYQENYGGDQENLYRINQIPNLYSEGFSIHSDNKGSDWMEDPLFDLFFRTYAEILKPNYDLFFSTQFRTRLHEYDLSGVLKSEINLFSLTIDSEEFIKTDFKDLSSSSAQILDFTIVSPEVYQVSVESSEPFVIVIPTTYRADWIVEGADVIFHFPAYSFLNGFYFDSTGESRMLIQREKQNLTRTGNSISLLSFFSLIAVLLLIKFKVFSRLLSRKPQESIKHS